MNQDFDIGTYLAPIRRRAGLFAITVLIVSGLGLLIAYILPPVYESTAKVMVEAQQIPGNLARSTVTASADEVLAKIEQRLKTRETIADMIARLNLYPDRADLSLGEKIALVRDRIEMHSTRVGRTRSKSGKVSAFTITYRADRAEVAAEVARDLLAKVLEQNRQTRSTHTSETLGFFDREVARLAEALTRAESDITQFKRENALSLPETLDFRRSEINELRELVFRRENERIDLLDRRRLLEQSLTQPTAIETVLSPEQRKLRELEAVLADQRSRFSERHPKVRMLRAQISATRKLIAPGGGDVPDRAAIEAARINEVQQQLDKIDQRVVLIDTLLAEAEGRVVRLETALKNAPRVEMALGMFERSREEVRVQYRNAVDKQAAAAVGARLEINQKAERFEVIEEPEVPARPVAPKRMLIATGGAVAAVGLGLGLVILAELLSTTIRTTGQLHARLDLRPVVAIPYIRTRAEIAHRRRVQRTAIIGLLVVVPGALYLTDQHVVALSLLAEQIMDTSGLDHIVHLIQDRISEL